MLNFVLAPALGLVLACAAPAGFCAPGGTNGIGAISGIGNISDTSATADIGNTGNTSIEASRGPVFSGSAGTEVSDFDRLDEVYGRPSPPVAAGVDASEAKAALVNNFGNGEVGYMRRTDSPATGYAVSMPAGAVQYTNVR